MPAAAAQTESPACPALEHAASQDPAGSTPPESSSLVPRVVPAVASFPATPATGKHERSEATTDVVLRLGGTLFVTAAEKARAVQAKKDAQALLKRQRVERLLDQVELQWVHDQCAMITPEVFLDDEGHWHNIGKAIKRGKKLVCGEKDQQGCGCQKRGATIGCYVNSCRLSYHFPCAVGTGWRFRRSRRFFCAAHRKDDHDTEVFCICGKVDKDGSDPYVQCDTCAEWYHPGCVGLTEDQAEGLDSWSCISCAPEQDSSGVLGEEELFCVCQQPYEGFYVGCESCAGWFHPGCVGMPDSEADLFKADPMHRPYVCPDCQANPPPPKPPAPVVAIDPPTGNRDRRAQGARSKVPTLYEPAPGKITARRRPGKKKCAPSDQPPPPPPPPSVRRMHRGSSLSCVCGQGREEPNSTIECKACARRFHRSCVGLSPDDEALLESGDDDLVFVCAWCAPPAWSTTDAQTKGRRNGAIHPPPVRSWKEQAAEDTRPRPKLPPRPSAVASSSSTATSASRAGSSPSAVGKRKATPSGRKGSIQDKKHKGDSGDGILTRDLPATTKRNRSSSGGRVASESPPSFSEPKRAKRALGRTRQSSLPGPAATSTGTKRRRAP